VDRRTFLVSSLDLLAAPLAAKAQTAPNVARIGVLEVGSAADASARMESFRKVLREFGRVEGQRLTIEWRFAEGQSAKLSRLAVELVGLKPDVLVASNRAGVWALRYATTAIPIVMAGVDAGTTLLTPQNLARPVVGNLTGVISMASEGEGKRMDLLRETRPAVSRVATLRDSTDFPYREGRMSKSQSERWGFTFIAIVVSGPDDFEGAFAGVTTERVGALSLPETPMFYTHRRRLAELAVRHRLAWIAAEREYAEAGSLMSFGADGNDLIRRAVAFVDKILRGAKPADLPVEQPTKFELVINLKTAKALGLTIPPAVLARADEVIQ
jgi:putative ABC transport system substrate-binding protein